MIAAFLLAASGQVFFDDFAYANRVQLEKRGWTVRSAAGWPGAPGVTWDPAGVTLSNGVLRLTANTDGTVAGTRQVQICHQRKYLEGTYAARVRFSDEPAIDEVVQTFYMITPLREPMAPEYSEMDFEYLPNGGWGRKGPVLFATTWETFHPEPQWKAVNVHDTKGESFAGWRTLVLQVADGNVRYFVDGRPFATHTGEYFPESAMSINFNLWFTRHGLKEGGGPREYRQEIDWVFHAAGKVLTPGEVDRKVRAFRRESVRFRDTVRPAKPPLDSPCNL